MWPPTETMIERAVLPDEVYAGEGGEVIEGKVGRGDEEEGEGAGEGEKKDWRKRKLEDELRVM